MDEAGIIFYGDPLCCWSYAAFLELKKFLAANKTVKSRICMGGMIPDWSHYHDSINSISRPAQMGPMWMQAHYLLSIPLQNTIWMNDPPASSYPPCIAVKCCQLQSPAAAEEYLTALYDAVMVEGRNISRKKVLLEIAEELSGETFSRLDFFRFQKDLDADKGVPLFKKDLDEINRLGIQRFPTFIFMDGESKLMATGYQSYEKLAAAFDHLISRKAEKQV
jgi:putative protein-disulfide isomerase